MLLEVAHLLNYQIVWHVGNVSGGIVVFAATRDSICLLFGIGFSCRAIKLLYGQRLECFQ